MTNELKKCKKMSSGICGWWLTSAQHTQSHQIGGVVGGVKLEQLLTDIDALLRWPCLKG